jgi:hypothetical protein
MGTATRLLVFVIATAALTRRTASRGHRLGDEYSCEFETEPPVVSSHAHRIALS